MLTLLKMKNDNICRGSFLRRGANDYGTVARIPLILLLDL
jgi:hypothetical protein